MNRGKNERVRKAVIAAAGFGTRFLPQTKAMPKEMLPIIDKPIIQYVVEELVASGITEIIIVTNYHKRAIEDHFDTPNAELAMILQQGGKQDQLEDLKKISDLANIAYIRQKEPLGSVGPIYYAREWVGQDPFIYTWSDDFILASPLRFKQMVDVYKTHGCSVLSCVESESDEDYDRYGFVAGEQIQDSLWDVRTIIEKPGKAKAPSNLVSVSGFLFTPDILGYLEYEILHGNQGASTQIQPAIQRLIDDNKRVIALKINNGRFYDAGNKLEYLKTVVDFALMHDDVKDDFKKFLKGKVSGD